MKQDWRPTKRQESAPNGTAEEPPFGTFAPNLLQRLMIGAARNSVLRRGLFRPSMSRMIHAVTGKPVDIHFRGCAFRIRGERNLIEYGLLVNPGYNAVDLDFLLDGAGADSNFVDVGANVGLYSLPLAKAVAASGTVVSIDANPLMTAELAWNAKASEIDNLRIFNCAVGDVEGRADLLIHRDDLAIVAIKESADGAVPVRRLSSVLEEAGMEAIHGLKIDIEGYEDKALVPFLDGAGEPLLPRRIVIEHPQPDRDYPGCAAAFVRRGYVLAGRTRNNSLYRLAAD